MKHHPRFIQIRIATCLAIDRLLHEGKFATAKAALTYIMVKAHNKGVKTGFEAETEEASYRRYRVFKHRYHSDIMKHAET